MKRPMPIAIAFFSSSGTAFMTDSRMPVRTRTVTSAPSSTTMPMASGQESPAPSDEPERNDRVEAHPGRDRVGLVRDEAHQDRHHAGDETGRGEHRVEGEALVLEARDPREAEDRRVDEDDVRHDHERGHPRERVAGERGAVFGEAELALEPPSLEPRRHRGHRAPPWTIGGPDQPNLKRESAGAKPAPNGSAAVCERGASGGVARAGIEPATPRFSAVCSTN